MFYGSQTGTAEEFANRLSKDAHRYGMRGMAADPEEYDLVSTPHTPALPVALTRVPRSWSRMCKGLSQPKGQRGMGSPCHLSRQPRGPRRADVSSGRRAYPACPAPSFLSWPSVRRGAQHQGIGHGLNSEQVSAVREGIVCRLPALPSNCSSRGGGRATLGSGGASHRALRLGCETRLY